MQIGGLRFVSDITFETSGMFLQIIAAQNLAALTVLLVAAIISSRVQILGHAGMMRGMLPSWCKDLPIGIRYSSITA